MTWNNIVMYLYMGSGGLCLFYFLLLRAYCGHIPAFGQIWMISGAILLGLGGGICLYLRSCLEYGDAFSWSGTVRVFLTAVTAILLFLGVCFALWVCCLNRLGKKKPAAGADYVIVLGAKVNGRTPSRALKGRIMTAFSYLEENPMTKVILTGGKGSGEEITEALCARQELIALGLEENRILMEDQSRNTMENIVFAGRYIEKRKSYIVIVTSDFHALRGQYLAVKAGFRCVESLGAPCTPVMKLHYYVRETFSWIKLGMITGRQFQKNMTES